MAFARIEDYRRYQRERRRIIRAEAVTTLGGCCKVCGSSILLEFHHRDPGEKFTHRLWALGKERIAKEIAGCVLLCREHHKLLHRLWLIITLPQYSSQQKRDAEEKHDRLFGPHGCGTPAACRTYGSTEEISSVSGK